MASRPTSQLRSPGLLPEPALGRTVGALPEIRVGVAVGGSGVDVNVGKGIGVGMGVEVGSSSDSWLTGVESSPTGVEWPAFVWSPRARSGVAPKSADARMIATPTRATVRPKLGRMRLRRLRLIGSLAFQSEKCVAELPLRRCHRRREMPLTGKIVPDQARDNRRNRLIIGERRVDDLLSRDAQNDEGGQLLVSFCLRGSPNRAPDAFSSSL